MNILIADDDRSSRILLSAQLKRLGHTVVAVGDGLAALEVLTGADPPQLAILDWIMPGQSGPDVCRTVRAQERERYTYIILLTAKNLVEERVEGLDSGADDYISKPVVPEELGARLRAGQRILALHEALIHARERLQVQATHDSLTGLWNRGAILSLLQAQSERCTQEERSLGVLLCDVDLFKSVNDTYGHLAGDAVLRIIAERISRSVRQTDFVGRYGGEEFLLVLPDCSEETLTDIAERIRLSVCMNEIAWSGFRLKASISIGATLQPSHADSTVEELIQSADASLFAAKRAGRNRVVTAPSRTGTPALAGRVTTTLLFAENEA